MADDHLIPNTTQVPNSILDLLMPFLNDGEARVLLYLCRRIYGFQRESDSVSLDQFVHGIRTDERQLDFGAGISRQGAMNALAVLKAIGIVEQTEGGRGRGNIPVFRINRKCEMVKWLDLMSHESENAREIIVERLDLIRKKGLPYGPFHKKATPDKPSEEKVENLDLSEKVEMTALKGLTVRPTKPSNTKPRKETTPEGTNVPSTPAAPPAYLPDDMRYEWATKTPRVPKNFPREPTEEMFTWATTETPHVDVRFEHGAFIDYPFRPHKDWYATWRGWMRRAERDAKKELARQQPRASPHAVKPPPPTPKELAAVTDANGETQMQRIIRQLAEEEQARHAGT